MKGKRIVVTIALAGLIVTGVTFGLAGTVAADSDSTSLGSVLDDADSTGEKIGLGARAIWAGLGGARDRTVHWASSKWGDDEPPSAASRADAVQTYWNNNNESFEQYGNERANWTTDKTVKIMWHINDETSTRYLLANATGDGNVTTRIVDSTSRTPNEDLALCGYAAEQSYSELQEFREEFVEPNEDVSAAYLGRMKGRYDNDVETSLYSSGGDCDGGAS